MNTPIMQLRERRKYILLILATAIFLALAIGVFTSYLSIVFSNHPIGLLLLSGVFLLVGCLLLKHIAFGDADQIVRLRGAIAFKIDDEMIEPVQIIGYSFNDDFCQYLCGFVHENKAYLKLLSNGDSSIVPMDRFDPDNLNHHTIINSVVEFTVLNQIELHLNSYFVDNEIDRSGIVTLSRTLLGAEVLKNRVIDQLTKDMKERPAFSRDSAPDTKGAVVYSQRSDGAVYQRLAIELPPNSTITRNSDGYMVIKNRIFDLTLMPKYEGFATYLPRIFTPSQNNRFTPLLVSLNMHIRVKSRAFLTSESMEMYQWLDSLVDRMHDYISTDRLTQRLDADLITMLAPKSTDLTRG